MSEKQWSSYTLAELAKLAENTIETLFKKASRQLTSKRKHEIRRQILQKENMTRMVSFTDQLKVRYERISIEYKQDSQAVFLKTCEHYHPTHIRVFARKLTKSQKSEYICETCGNKCNSVTELQPDAFIMSYYENVKNFEGATIILNRKAVGSVAQKEQEQQAEINQNTTVILLDGGQIELVTIKILQIVNDENTSALMNKEVIAQQIERSSESIQTAEFETRELALYPSQMLSNLIDFDSAVRIRNPLQHRHCKPADHNGRLIFYSFEHVYHKIFEQKTEGTQNKTKIRSKKTNIVKCIMASCPNQFDRQNFQDVAVIVNSIRNVVYQEEKQCMFGQYFNSHYTKNWHTSNAESRILSFVNRTQYFRYHKQIKQNVFFLTTTINLSSAKRYVIKSKKKVIDNYNKEKENMKTKNDLQNIIAVDLGAYNLCPTRCRSCTTLNSNDAFLIAYHYQSSAERKCYCCQLQSQKSFADSFYIDLDQMKFIFFEGHAPQVYFDVCGKKYFHKMSFYTGSSLRNKLKKQEKTYSGDIRKSDLNIKLDKNRRYVPFMDQRCINSVKSNQNINDHFIYLNEQSKGNETVKCGVADCDQNIRPVRVDCLVYCEQLDLALRSHNNSLEWKGNTESKHHSSALSISSLKFYSDIKREAKNLEEQHNVSDFFARNYQGQFIEYPFRFRQCRHSFESSICDFKDLLYQIRVEKRNTFQCRYKNCQIIYANADELQRLPFEVLGSFEGKQDLLREANAKNNYWLKYDFSSGEIISLINQTSQLREEEQKYRIREWKTEPESKRTINSKISKLTNDIQNTQKKVREDRSNIEQSKPLRHFSDITMIQQIVSGLDKKRSNLDQLKKQKQVIVSKELAETRVLKNTSYVNFGRLSELFPKDIRGLEFLKRQPDRQEVEEVVIDNIRTYGNISIFKYPVPRFVSYLPERKEDVRALIDQALQTRKAAQAQDKKKPRS